MKKIVFHVAVGEKRMPVEFDFASEDDLARIQGWANEVKQQDNPHVQDALEYSQLAHKRWRSYSENGRTVTSFTALESAIRKNPTKEVVFVMVVRARLRKSAKLLGFCFCRRSWAHHLILDFAAAHPEAIVPAGGEIKRVGMGMLYSRRADASKSKDFLILGALFAFFSVKSSGCEHILPGI